MSAAQGITIDKLKLRTARQGLATIVNDLGSGTWPTMPNDDWVFVRSLEVKARKSDLRYQAGRMLDKILLQAVTGEQANPHSNAVRFKNLPDLLAYLLRDLSSHQLASRWYWQRWHPLLNKTTSQAICDILWEHSALLPAVMMRLIDIEALGTVVHSLTDAEVELLVRRIHSLHDIHNDSGNQNTMQDEEYYDAVQRYLESQGSVMQAWSRCVVFDKPQAIKWQFAAACTGLSYFPTLYRRAPDRFIKIFQLALGRTHGLEAFNRLLPDHNPDTSYLTILEKQKVEKQKVEKQKIENQRVEDRSGNSIDTHHVNQSDPVRSAHVDELTERQTVLTNAFAAPGNSPTKVSGAGQREHALTRSKTDPAFSSTLNALSKHTLNGAVDSDKKQASTEEKPVFLNDATLHSEFGGFFFLINALRMLGGLERNLQTLGLDHPSLWVSLYLLARQLQTPLDSGIQNFICIHSAFKDSDALANYLSTAEERASVKAETIRLVEKIQTAFPGIWQSELLYLPASIRFSASHIDCYFPMSSLRLDIRLAGLDVNPGWVPELSRVIQFYYREQV